MSVDAHELERVALQRKDREQLQAIAVAMGRKPPARARKDQIIEMIMELAGQSAPAAPAAPAAEAAVVAAVAPAPVSDRRAPAADATDGDGRLPFDSPESTNAPRTPAARTRDGAEPVEPAEPEPADAGERPGADDGARVPAARSTQDSASPSARVASFSPWNERGPRPAGSPRPDRGEQRAPAVAPGDGLTATSHAVSEPVADRADDDRDPDRDRETARDNRDTGRETDRDADRDADRDDRDDADGGADREGGGRRRRRRGRDKDRAERGPTGPVGPGGVPTHAGQGQPAGGQQGPSGPGGGNQGPTDRHDGDRHDRTGGDEGVQGNGQNLNEAVTVVGHLDLRDEGYGFLRLRGYLPSKEDVYVPAKFVRQFGLRKGDQLTGMSRPAGRGEKNPALLRVDAVNGEEPEKARTRRRFEDLTPLYPDAKLRLESANEPFNMTARIIDLISPIGKGQRGLIVSPPKAGKTTVLKTIAQSIEANNPEVHLIVLLVDERPEEVTDMRRSVKGEVVASTFDRPADEHTHVAEMTLERAKRLVEGGADVVIVLDGITRLARAYNLAAPATGRIMSGGIDTGALYPPKKFFGAARNVEEGGSLTILATALVETGSRMDEVIFEEFKGTGNMELRLDRRMAEKRIYPAIDVDGSSTRHEELLFERRQLQMVWKLRRVLSGLSDGPGGGLELLIDRMRTFKSNDEFLAEIAKGPAA